jgi:RHS repeat-associated protein
VSITRQYKAESKYAKRCPFGMMIEERSYTATAKGYRFGFNGKGSDDEVSGIGNQYDYGFRIYNPRLGKFLSVDPLTSTYPWYTPYQFAGNGPILNIDLDGLEDFDVISYWSEEAGGYITKMTLLSDRDATDIPLKLHYTLTTKDGNLIKKDVDHYLTEKQKRDGEIIMRKGTNYGLYTQHRDQADLANLLDPKKSTTPVSLNKPIPKQPTPKKSPIVDKVPTAPKPATKTIDINLKGANFDGNSSDIDGPGLSLRSDDISEILKPATDILKNDPTATLTITVGTGCPTKNCETAYGNAEDLLNARFNEVVRQMKVADPSVDVSRIKQKNSYHTKLSFTVKATTTK